jgi:4-hydroxy-3-methylbut-2-enyl diphosphate reductase
MRVLQAQAMGMCFGVRDALELTRTVERPEDVTIHGELVHNPAVLVQLTSRGFRMSAETSRAALPSTDRVLVTAHGISDRERARLKSAGKQLIDATCPLVRRAHEAALRLQCDGYHVLVIGKRGHVEIEGLTGDLHSFTVIQSPAQVRTYAHSKLGIICQTTSAARDVCQIRTAIVRLNPRAEIRFVDTVCQPTKDRQLALEQLLDEVDAMVIVGGRNSNNTRKLVERCAARGVRAYHVEGRQDLNPDWFIGCDAVGLTAGTSTLDTTIEAVREMLEQFTLAAEFA